MTESGQTLHIFKEIILERLRQEELREKGVIKWTLADAVVPSSDEVILDAERLAVLAEEFGEVSQEVCRGLNNGVVDDQALRAELIQVAACCVAWIEHIDG